MYRVPHGCTIFVNTTRGDGPRRSTITCFRCGEAGHFRNECHTYRVQRCHYTAKECPDRACTKAHTAEQMRQPWMPKCIRVTKINGRIQTLGCGKFGHTFRMCPHNVFSLNAPQ